MVTRTLSIRAVKIGAFAAKSAALSADSHMVSPNTPTIITIARVSAIQLFRIGARRISIRCSPSMTISRNTASTSGSRIRLSA